MLYVFDEIHELDDAFPARCIPYLSDQRREKAFSYRFPIDRKLSVTAYLLLRLALRENYGIDEPVVFAHGRNGKPFLRDYPQVHFNVSHCRSAVVCAVSDGAVGVDAEEIFAVSDELAVRVLTEKEYAAFKAADNPSVLFCEYWTIKESWLKKTGQGIGVDLTAVAAEDIGEKTLFTGSRNYCCCVAGASVRLRRVNLREML